MEIISAPGYRESIVNLLASEHLPVDDLPQTLEYFMIAVHEGNVTGVAGLEIYGNYGLLRSLAVKSSFRNTGIADKLVKQLETIAISKGLKAICLLTETAPDYFIRKGYESINRNDVPEAIQQSTEFSYVCPKSAIVMKKELTK